MCVSAQMMFDGWSVGRWSVRRGWMSLVVVSSERGWWVGSGRLIVLGATDDAQGCSAVQYCGRGDEQARPVPVGDGVWGEE